MRPDRLQCDGSPEREGQRRPQKGAEVGDDTLDLVIVGAGPVGLVAALEAAAAGLRFVLLERNTSPWHHSRAIGIHPPSMRRLHQTAPEVVEALVEAGIRIRRGHGFGRHRASGVGAVRNTDRRSASPRLIGSLDFGLLGQPFDFILTLEQWRTESILEDALEARAPGALRRGVEVTGIRREGAVSTVEAMSVETNEDASGHHTHAVEERGPAAQATFRTALAVACDGKGSRLRAWEGIGFEGGGYGARYMMGDFPGESRPGTPAKENDALLFLAREGLVESFPLPGAEDTGPVRRWVAEIDARCQVSPGGLVEAVDRRCGVRLEAETCRGFSTFEAERFMADTFVGNGVVLVGDAAHVVSPIGGQGMNLGWINAGELVDTLVAGGDLRTWEARARRRARKATRRAEQNMLLGNRVGTGWVAAARESLLRLTLSTPFAGVLARRFSMGGL